MCVFFLKPLLEFRQILALKLERQVEEVGMNLVATACGSTVALPDRVSCTIHGIVVSDFVALRNVTARDDETLAVYGLYECVGITRMIYMSLRDLHENNFAAFEVITMALVFAAAERSCLVHHARIIDLKNDITRQEWPCRKYTVAFDGGSANKYAIAHKRYSVRNARIGSIEAARLAGMNPAAVAHKASTKVAMASALGS